MEYSIRSSRPGNISISNIFLNKGLTPAAMSPFVLQWVSNNQLIVWLQCLLHFGDMLKYQF